MQTFHIPINLELNRRGHKPLQKGKKKLFFRWGVEPGSSRSRGEELSIASSFQGVFRGDNVIPRVNYIDKTQHSLPKSSQIRSFFDGPNISPLQSLFSEFSVSQWTRTDMIK